MTKKEIMASTAIEEKPILLTEDEVWEVTNYVRSLFGMGSNIFTPDLINSRMKDVTLNSKVATQTELTSALSDPKNNEQLLQRFSEDFELQSQPYKRLISYLGSMLSFDLTYNSTNAEFSDYGTPKYKKDFSSVEAFLDKIDYKKEFATVVRQMLRNEAVFVCPRMEGKKIILQELPSEYCKITGRWEHGLVFSFNMYWFMIPGVDIKMYPSFFKKKFDEWSSGKQQHYNPSATPQERGSSSWVYWVDVPVDVGWCFKMTPELATRVPYFSPLFNDLVLQSMMRNLQRDINMSVAARMIIGQVPMLNKDAKTVVKDSIALSPELLGKFMYLLKSAISNTIGIGSTPLTDTKQINFPAENEVYDQYLKTTMASSGVNSNLIFSSDIKPNTIETQLSLNVDEQLMYILYPQFNSFLEYHANKFVKTFNFEFTFEGTLFYNNREQRLTVQKDLMAVGIVLPQKIAAAIGMRFSSFRRQLEEGRANGFTDDLTPIIPAANLANAGAGAPKKSDSDLSDSGQATRAGGTNIGRKSKSK